MAGFRSLKRLVELEIKQREEEGYSVSGCIERWKLAGEDEVHLMHVYESLSQLEVRSGYSYIEPSDLEQIRLERPAGPRKLEMESWPESIWQDRFYGAWLGRAAGCALGKPLEANCFLYSSNGYAGYENIRHWFEGANAWPIANYTPGQSKADELYKLSLVAPKSWREQIQFMETDDDIRYTILGLQLLEEHGGRFTSYDVAQLWLTKLPYRMLATAEMQTYKNLTQVAVKWESYRAEFEAKRDWIRTYLNPYREWIGAQIRADIYGYAAAGHPERAAELAWRDASLSSVKNGIYGAMFVAAMISSAFFIQDPLEIVRIGLSEIPQASRLAADIAVAIEIAQQAKDCGELASKLHKAFHHYDPVHTNNNAAVVAASLIHANGEFEKAITTAVQAGWDTDCNGATVGSIMGAMVGASQLPSKWTAPLNDLLYSEISGFDPIRISECASRTYRVFQNIQHEQSENNSIELESNEQMSNL